MTESKRETAGHETKRVCERDDCWLHEKCFGHCATSQSKVTEVQSRPQITEAVFEFRPGRVMHEESAADLWAEIHRLRAAVKGPDGYDSWQDAAVAERIRRVKAEQSLAARVALTDERIDAIHAEVMATANGTYIHAFARAIERAHNHGKRSDWVDPDWYYVECDDPDHSQFVQSFAEAQTITADHGGMITALYEGPLSQTTQEFNRLTRTLCELMRVMPVPKSKRAAEAYQAALVLAAQIEGRADFTLNLPSFPSRAGVKVYP